MRLKCKKSAISLNNKIIFIQVFNNTGAFFFINTNGFYYYCPHI